MVLRKKVTNTKRAGNILWKKHAINIFIFLTCILIALAYFYDPLIPGKEISGILDTAYKIDSRYGNAPLRYIVSLDSGGIADINANYLEPFEKGRRVVLREMTGKFFKKKKYHFLRYEEPMPEKKK